MLNEDITKALFLQALYVMVNMVNASIDTALIMPSNLMQSHHCDAWGSTIPSMGPLPYGVPLHCRIYTMPISFNQTIYERNQQEYGPLWTLNIHVSKWLMEAERHCPCEKGQI